MDLSIVAADASPRPAGANPARWGFILLAALLALAGAAKAVLYDTADPDSFIHLLAANQLTRDGIGPIVDDQSYMSIRQPWTPYSWLAELGMKFVWDHGTYRAAVACHALMAAGLITFVTLGCLAARPRAYVATSIAVTFTAFFSLPFLSFRPATLALVIMAACVWLLVRDRAARERSHAVWLVIPLTALLANIHLYAVILPAWIGALWLGAVWDMLRATDPDRRFDCRRRWARYTLLGIGAGIGCLATPMLPGVIRSITFYQFGDPMVAGPAIKEYLPFYTGTAGKISAALVVGMLSLAIARRNVLRAGEICWLVVSVVLLLRMGRFSPMFAMASAPILTTILPKISDRVFEKRSLRLAMSAVLAVGILRVTYEFPGPRTTLDAWMNRNGPDCPGYPADAAAFVETHVPAARGRIINEYTWGGYLSWRLYPRYRVLLDGRTNLFTPAFWRETYLSPPEGRAKFLRQLDADAAIVPTDGTHFGPALRSLGWTVAYSDARATVLVPPAAKAGETARAD